MMARLKLVPRTRNKKRDDDYPRRQRVKQLGWMLYITEGYIANLQHALAVNAYTLDAASLRVIKAGMKDAQFIALDIRKELAK